MFHLSLRVAWHHSRWNGSVCQTPGENTFCASLDRIRQEEIPEREQVLSGGCFSTLAAAELPPCKAESGAFMNEKEWVPSSSIRTPTSRRLAPNRQHQSHDRNRRRRVDAPGMERSDKNACQTPRRANWTLAIPSWKSR